MTSSLIRTRAFLSAIMVCSLITTAGCDSSADSEPYRLAELSHGVVFTYPIDEQTDVHPRSRFYATFSRAVSASAISATCNVDGSGNVSGNFCLIGPDSQVMALSTNINGNIIAFESTQLQQGTDYALYVRSPVIGGGSTNLPSSAPLLTFTTTQFDPISGQAPQVKGINGAPPNAPRHPFLDFTTLHVEFTEPLNEASVTQNASFQFVEIDGATETPVDGEMLVHKQHISFDPTNDLAPGMTYRLTLNGIDDLNAETITPISYDFVPEDSNRCDCLITQQFKTTGAFGESDFPQTSVITGEALNSLSLSSPLIGSNTMNLRDTTLEATLADPSDFSGLIPFVIRKGAYLDITGLELQLGGEVAANLTTGAIQAHFITDLVGFLDHNPYRSAGTVPDDDKAPIFVYLYFDLALTGNDPVGNGVFNQIVPNIKATGTARIVDGQLYIESVRTLPINLLGLTLAPAHLVMGIHSSTAITPIDDMAPPQLSSSYPADGTTDVSISSSLSLIFNEPIALSDVTGNSIEANNQITLEDLDAGSALVPFQITWDGSTLLIQPESPLTLSNNYQITIGAVTDLAGNTLSLDVSDASGGDGVIAFGTEDPDLSTTVGPMITATNVGAPCATTSATYLDPGTCVGGLGTDETYIPVNLPTTEGIRVSFNQVMNASSFTLGNSGSIRVEELDGTGASLGIVAGTLVPESRGFRFIPNAPWQAGTQYRLTLVGGTNTTCVANEICGANNRPLNTDPLTGALAANAGGSNVVKVFQAVDDSSKTLLPLKLAPISDSNGNGYIDGSEVGNSQNSAAVSVSGFSGIVVSAGLVGSDTIYLQGNLPVSLGASEPLTIDGSDWGTTFAGDSQIPVQVHPGVLYGTSITLASSARVTVIININVTIENTLTGMSVLRLVETAGQPVQGYIVQEQGSDTPLFVGQLDLYMDAPDMSISPTSAFLSLLTSVNHDLVSKPITAIVKGPVTFGEDGRITIEQANVNDIDIAINVDAIGQNGAINLQIPAGAMQLRFESNPVKGQP